MKRGNKKRDKPRLVSIRDYLLIYLVLMIVSGCHILIYQSIMGVAPLHVEVMVSQILSLGGYVALMSALVCLLTGMLMNRSYVRPLRRLGEASRRIAGGEFSVRVEKLRRGNAYVDTLFEDFNKMAEALATIETLQGDFIANVSHEIKTPLSVIQSYATALEKPDLGPECREEYTNTIIDASQRLNALVTNILKLSKLENQEIAPALEEYDLCRQLCDCALAFEDLWEAKGITFAADLDDRAVIRADQSMLEIVWNNLLSNALKFTEPGGTVTLTQTSEADAVTVTVSDTGCGMDEETVKRIFDKFYQGDTSHAQEGNGLGLALVRRVVDRLNGTLSVSSEPGQGSAVTVRLPI